MIIRTETPADHGEVYALVKAAFATTDFSDGSEPNYLNRMRHSAAFVPELSLVAVENDAIVGQIVLYKTPIACGDKTETQLVLSPLSVRPDHFGRGVGAALIQAGCDRAAKLGYGAVFLCGDSAYYARFGFVPTWQYGIFHEKDAERHADWCMVKELKAGGLRDIQGTINIE